MNPPAFAEPDGSGAGRPAGSAGPRPIVVEPTYIFQGPVDPEAIRQRLGRPDLVILDGDGYDRLRKAAGATLDAPRAPEAVVEAVAVTGQAVDGLARLAVDYSITLAGDGPTWVPIRLDGHAIARAREDDRDLPLRVAEAAAEGASWEVQLTGAGPHRVSVHLISPVHTEGAVRRVALPIRPAVATSVQLDVPAGAVEPQAGPGDVLEVVPMADEAAGRWDRIVAAGLTPRERLTLTWRAADEAAAAGPPMLTARGDIALEIHRGVVLSRSSWSIECVRGVARSLELRFDDRGEELLTVELDDSPVPIGESFDLSRGLLTLELPEPLRSDGAELRLAVTTRRPLPAELSAQFRYRGLAIHHAVEQAGVVALVQGEDLWVTATPGRGLRQINPLTDLTEGLRTRPKIVLAYRFMEQPFDLRIRADPAPPSLQVDVRTTVAVDATTARVETELDYTVTRGRVQEVRVGLPAGLELVAVGPDTVVEGSEGLDEEEVDPEETGGRVQVVRLRESAAATGSTFRIRLSGRQAIAPGDTVRVGLFRPLVGTARATRVAVLATRDVAIDLVDGGRGGPFLPIAGERPIDWPGPAEPLAAQMVPALWLWSDLNPRHLALGVSVRTLTFHHETIVTAEIDRRRWDLRQETTCHVRDGVLDHLDVIVPGALDGRWELEGDAVVSRERLGTEADGSARYRLVLGRETIDLVRLRFLARLPVDPPLAVDRATLLEIHRIRVRGGSASPTRVQIAADPGIGLGPGGEGWQDAADAATTARDGGPPVRLVWSGAEPGSGTPRLRARAPATVALPPLVASRLWIRTYEGLDGRRQSTAWYRVESHQGAFSVALPPDAELIRAQVGHDAVEPENRPGGLRLRLPPELSAPLLVRLDYRLPPEAAGRTWEPPRLLDGGMVQETLWEVQVPWSRAVVGTPAGWVDENRWYWGGYVWMRRPGLDESTLARWIGGTSARGRVEGPSPQPARGGYHGYMFGRAGDPIPLEPAVGSRAGLVGIFSGLVLAIGVLLLFLPSPGRLGGLVLLAAALALVAAIWPAVTLLAVQASMAGVILTALAALTKRQVERRYSSATLFGESSQVSGVGPSGSGVQPLGSSQDVRAEEVGSEESTVIRRHPSTVDYVPTLQRGSGAQPSG